MMSTLAIKESVGVNGKNVKQDVVAIQSRLNHWIKQGKLPYVPELRVDGVCGPRTKLAVKAFQNRFLAFSHPDGLVSANGKTADGLFNNFSSRKIPEETYLAWCTAMGMPVDPMCPQAGTGGWLSEQEASQIRAEWGDRILAWARTPAIGTEAKEFFPEKRSDVVKVVFVWKSQTPNTACVPNPNQRIQFLSLLRDDMPFWLERTKGRYQQAIALRSSQETLIRDYRTYIITHKMCPTVAYKRLDSVGKDVIFQALLGMFQLLSPMGLSGASASSSAIANGIYKLTEGFRDWEDSNSLADNLRAYKWPWNK